MNKKITLSLLALLVAISAGLFLMAHPAHACACDVAPDTVTGLSATATIYSEATLSWNTPTNNGPVITDYYIQYRLYNTGGWTDISHTPSDATSTTLSGLSQNTIYEFQVAAVNSIGTSTMSDPLQFATTLSTTYTDATFVLASNTSSRFLGINMFNTIQAAINAVDDGGQVDIASSTYSEHLSVGRDISLYGEDSSDLIRTVHLISPDCEVPLMLISASTTFMQGLDLDQNDMSHTCTVPMIIVSPGAAFLSIANIFENASLAMEAAATSTVVNALTDFTNDTTAIRSDSVESFVYEPYNYWGSDTGPLQTITNPTGVGASIIGTGGANVFFRPYMNEDIMNPDVAPVVLATTTYDHIQDLLGNGGSYWRISIR